jgi:hypothetical protein
MPIWESKQYPNLILTEVGVIGIGAAGRPGSASRGRTDLA